jgi:hypothetical protein
MGGLGVDFSVFCLFDCYYSGVRGGGKCPEEEHTTCSGGPTILVTSAVYGEREIILFHKIKKREKNIIFNSENKIFCERIKCEKTVKYP